MLIGARQSLWRGGRLSARSYVQDGLIAQWDGIENAGYGRHDPNAKAWKDLKGLVPDLILSNCEVGSNALHTKGITDSRAYAENVDVSSHLTNSMSVESCISGVMPRYGIMFVLPPFDHAIFGVWDGRMSIFDNGDVKYGNTQCWVVRDLVGTFSAISSNIDNIREQDVFQNTLKLNTARRENWSNRDGVVVIGQNTVGGYPWDGNFYSVRIYNRALTPEEIAQNYAIDKERFNI